MDLRGFIEERKPAWRELETLLDKADRTRFALTPAEAQQLGSLYRRASADLCRAQARTANAELLRYLNGLVARAYGLVHSGRKFRWYEVSSFFWTAFPALVRDRWRPLALSTGLVALGFLFGFLAASLDEDARHFLVPERMREVTKRLDELTQSQQTRALSPGQSAIISSFIMANNIRVCFMAFALGITLGFGTAIVLFYNGVMIGVLAAYFHRAGYALNFWALILPHGVTELLAIFISGAAGLVIGSALLAPGSLTRRQALRRRGLEAVRLGVGCVPLLVIAGVIEGFVTPQGYIPDVAKIAFGSATAIALALYFAPPGGLSRLVRGS